MSRCRAAEATRGPGAPPSNSKGRKAAILIPVLGSLFVAAFAADEYFEKDSDGSPKLP